MLTIVLSVITTNLNWRLTLTENREGKNPWHCWACDVRGTTIYSLFKQLKVDTSKFTELKSLS